MKAHVKLVNTKNKCEFEIVYDATNTDSNGNKTQNSNHIGYFRANFSQNTTGCSFTPSQVVKSTTPIIASVPIFNLHVYK